MLNHGSMKPTSKKSDSIFATCHKQLCAFKVNLLHLGKDGTNYHLAGTLGSDMSFFLRGFTVFATVELTSKTCPTLYSVKQMTGGEGTKTVVGSGRLKAGTSFMQLGIDLPQKNTRLRLHGIVLEPIHSVRGRFCASWYHVPVVHHLYGRVESITITETEKRNVFKYIILNMSENISEMSLS